MISPSTISDPGSTSARRRSLSATAIEGCGHVSARRGATSADPRWGMVKAGVLVLSLIFSAGLLAMEIGSRNHPWFCWFTLLPLLTAIRVLPPRKAFSCGALWGAALFLFLVSGAGPLIPVSFLWLLLLILLPAAYAFVGARVTRRHGFNPLILGFAWAGVEVALIPLGLSGGLLGGASGHQAGSSLYILEGLVGYVCVASIIVAANGILLGMLRRACVGACGLRRYVSGCPNTQTLFFPGEVPAYLFFFTNPAQPRAPPTY